jgi:hypothetical protein
LPQEGAGLPLRYFGLQNLHLDIADIFEIAGCYAGVKFADFLSGFYQVVEGIKYD